MIWWLLFAVFLFVACAALIIAEVFIPSGGILSICALACAAGGVVIFFKHSMAAGCIGVVVAILDVPVLLFVVYKLLPETRLGRRVMPVPRVHKRTDEFDDLLGQAGRVLTPLRPVGMCELDGRRIECIAESAYVPKDKEITVVRVEGTQVTVRVIEKA